jgi:UDP-glucose:(heptosyl)LPS alpha-1,3-glucosyltransferase
MNADANPTRRLKIAVLNRSFVATGGGAERYSIALVEHLAERHEIHVYAQHIDHHWPGVTYHKLWTPLTRPRWINQLWFALTSWWATRKGFDVVHSHENTWHGQVQTVHVLPVKYTLFQGRMGWHLALRWLKVVTSPRLLAYLLLEIKRYAYAKNRRVVATSPSLRYIMEQTFPATAPMLEVLTPGVNAIAGIPSPQARTAARKSLGLPEQGRCVLFVGNDYRKKGLDALLKALQQLPADIYLAVVGNGAHIPPFRTVAESSGLKDRVFFLGSLRDVEQAYIAADCLAHPTLEDTFAMVVLEAMSHGIPVVVSGERHCGISSLLRDNVDALILEDPTDHAILAQFLRRLLSHRSLYESLSRSGTAFAAVNQWSRIALLQEKIYESTLAVKFQ